MAGEVAAALAHAAVAFADYPELSALYWEKAQLAYNQTGVRANEFRNSNDAFVELRIWYRSCAASLKPAHLHVAHPVALHYIALHCIV